MTAPAAAPALGCLMEPGAASARGNIPHGPARVARLPGHFLPGAVFSGEAG